VLNGVNSCQVRVKLSNFIQLTARLTVSVSNFYNNNGPTTFLTNICAFLGIDAGRLKIVSVRTGSAEVTVYVIPQPLASNASTSASNPSTASASMSTMANDLSSGIANSSLSFGYPVTTYTVSAVVFNPDGTIYSPSNGQNSNTVLILATVIPAGIIIIAVTVWVCLRRLRSKIYSHEILGLQSSQMDITEKKDHISNLDHVSNEKYELEIADIE
jgi:hypothetical protein